MPCHSENMISSALNFMYVKDENIWDKMTALNQKFMLSEWRKLALNLPNFCHFTCDFPIVPILSAEGCMCLTACSRNPLIFQTSQSD